MVIDANAVSFVGLSLWSLERVHFLSPLRVP